MGVAQELLLQARYLTAYGGAEPSQVWLRRSVSTAYYALFHLLVEDAALRWQGASAAAGAGLQRALSHSSMKNASALFKRALWADWHGTAQPVPLPLRNLAELFAELPEKRHAADYDNHRQWTATHRSTTYWTRCKRPFRTGLSYGQSRLRATIFSPC